MVATDGRPGTSTTPSITLSLYVRLPIAGDRTVTIDRLTALEAAGVVDAVEITRVHEQVILSEAGEAHGSADVGATFERLADWRDGDLESTFDVTTATTRTGRSVRKVPAPPATLAVHADDALVGVFPCTDGERSWTVADAFDALERTGALPADGPVELSPA